MKFTFNFFKKFNTTISFVIIVIVSICILEITSYYNSSKSLNTTISQSFINRAKDNANLLSQVFNEKLIALELISEENDIQSMDWERQKKQLLKYVKIINVKRLKISDKTGLTRSTDEKTHNSSDRDYFKKAIAGQANVSDVLISKIDGSKVFVFAAPIRAKNGETVGVLSYTVDYDVLAKMINNIEIGKYGYAYLINKDGATIIHPDKNQFMVNDSYTYDSQRIPEFREIAEIEKKMMNGETGIGYYHYYSGINKVISYAPINGTEWILGLTIPRSEIYSEIDSLKKRLIRDTIFFCLIFLAVSYLVMSYYGEKRKVKDLKKNAEENSKSLANLAELDKLKTEFFANITHELRTPINVIYGALQLFEHAINNKVSQNTQDVTKRIKSMKQNCFRMLRLVNNLIDVTKIDADYFELNIKNKNIIQVIEDITLSVADYIKDKGIELVFDTEIEEKIMAIDDDKIERILLNLLSNATKYTDAGGSIFVNVYDKDDKLVITVKDTGVGIPKDKQQVIFERFRQANESLSRSNEGSGLGLSIVKSLVNMHSGKISVNSEPGFGSEFIIELPVNILPEDITNKKESNVESSRSNMEKVNIEFSDIYF